jgi:hypothetical protein
VLPISFASKEIGIDNESGSALSGPSGLPGVVAGLTAGVEVIGAGAGGGVVVVVVFGTVVVVLGKSDEIDVGDGATLEVAAPAGPRPASTLAAARTRPPVSTAIEEKAFRLKMLLLLCRGYTDPL